MWNLTVMSLPITGHQHNYLIWPRSILEVHYVIRNFKGLEILGEPQSLNPSLWGRLCGEFLVC